MIMIMIMMMMMMMMMIIIIIITVTGDQSTLSIPNLEQYSTSQQIQYD